MLAVFLWSLGVRPTRNATMACSRIAITLLTVLLGGTRNGSGVPLGLECHKIIFSRIHRMICLNTTLVKCVYRGVTRAMAGTQIQAARTGMAGFGGAMGAEVNARGGDARSILQKRARSPSTCDCRTKGVSSGENCPQTQHVCGCNSNACQVDSMG
jgi:hypothetical protein